MLASVDVAAAYTWPFASTPRPELARPASVSAPVELNDDVAVAPKYAVPKFEKLVDDALENICSAVQMFALPRLRETVPLVVMVPPERPVPAVMEVTVPLPPPEGVVVAMTVPSGETARNVPVGVPRFEMVRLEVEAVSEEGRRREGGRGGVHERR